MHILVADDQTGVLDAARLLLKSEGYRATTVDTPRAALNAAERERFDLILMDLNYARDTTSGQEGLDLLRGLQAAGVQTPVVVMTAWGSVDPRSRGHASGSGRLRSKAVGQRTPA